ncbi:hypothetical protein MITSMUL_03743 [Mitsuokella multacida DSM 20544]|uniref:Uncharacterized protein n=1 Tax=Mitsuokella multacida DSM 20544 TaxID=500635 RepID=C9KKP3_9FIRM|nr:hypothetical protein MITSMUL_03743 [Mitsuokella multacida DSM 20544]
MRNLIEAHAAGRLLHLWPSSAVGGTSGKGSYIFQSMQLL